MFDYSIEQSAENIYHSKTKEYFREVLQSYMNGSYRSAVVMLYSVVMCDLIYKLKDLDELYEDEVAKSILSKIAETQNDEKNGNGRKGGWEATLIDEVKQRTSFFEEETKVNFEHLRSHRHLSAHPVLTQEDLLSTPSKESVRAHMRNMLEGLLIKNPIMSKKVVNTILEDLEARKNFFLDDDSLENYLESRYLKNTNEHVIKDIFKTLWGVTFKCNDARCKDSRKINIRVLKLLYKRNRTILTHYMEQTSIPFNNVNLEDQVILSSLLEFITEYPDIYKVFEPHNRQIIEEMIKENAEFRIRAAFLSSTFEEHIDDLITNLYARGDVFPKYKLSETDRNLLFKWAKEGNCVDKFYDLIINQFIHSLTFDSAHNNFISCIDYLPYFKEEHFLLMYKGINENGQCYGHRNAKNDNTHLKEFSDKVLGEDFDYSTQFYNVRFRD